MEYDTTFNVIKSNNEIFSTYLGYMGLDSYLSQVFGLFIQYEQDTIETIINKFIFVNAEDFPEHLFNEQFESTIISGYSDFEAEAKKHNINNTFIIEHITSLKNIVKKSFEKNDSQNLIAIGGVGGIFPVHPMYLSWYFEHPECNVILKYKEMKTSSKKCTITFNVPEKILQIHSETKDDNFFFDFTFPFLSKNLKNVNLNNSQSTILDTLKNRQEYCELLKKHQNIKIHNKKLII